MEFETVSEFDFPRERVFAAYRDSVEALKKYLPNVTDVRVVERTDEGEQSKLVNEWNAGGELPAVIRPFVPSGATGWTDHASWDAARFTCAWRTVPHAFRDAVRSAGDHRFEDLGGGRTRVTVKGYVEVDPKQIPGVPKLIAGTLKGPVEQFVVSSVRENLKAFARAAESYLREQG